jgi:histidinol-phosphate phosphatase family protein
MARSKKKQMKFIQQIYRESNAYKGVVFLDRDGTIIENVDYLNSIEKIKILTGVVDGIKLLNKKQIAVIIVTNQPVVARGIISINKMKQINDSLFNNLKDKKACVDAIYSCPHHPERGYPDIPEKAMKFRIKCECRKPGIAMYKKAMSEFNSENILGVIGDQTRDIMASKKISAPGVLVKTGYGGADAAYDVKPDFIANSLLDAVRKLF